MKMALRHDGNGNPFPKSLQTFETFYQKPFSSFQVEEIQDLLDGKITNLSKPWKGCLPFSVHIIVDKHSVTTKIFSPPPVEINICDYLEAGKYPTERLYFSPATYPPPQNDEEMQCAERNNKCEGWLNLKRDLQVASLEEGNFGIYSNGGGSGTKRFVCATTHRGRGKKRHERRKFIS